MSNWRELLRAQEEDLKRMEEMDAALNEDQQDLDLNIKAILRGSRPISKPNEEGGHGDKRMNSKIERVNINKTSNHLSSAGMSLGGKGIRSYEDNELDHDLEDDDNNVDDDGDDDDHQYNSSHIQISKSDKSILSPSSAVLKDPHLKQAPDTTARSRKFISFHLILQFLEFKRHD